MLAQKIMGLTKSTVFNFQHSNLMIISSMHSRHGTLKTYIISTLNTYHTIGRFSRQQTDDIFLIFSYKNDHFMHIVSFGDSLYEVSYSIFYPACKALNRMDTLSRFSTILTREATSVTSCLLSCTSIPFRNGIRVESLFRREEKL